MQGYFFDAADINLSEFTALCSQTVRLEDYRFAAEIQQKLVVYEEDRIRSVIGTPQARELKTELHHCLKEGPGVFAIRGACPDLKAVDRATEVFRKIIAEEKERVAHRGDHFAKPGDNERIWNALQKFCERDPEAFVAYYDNPVLCFVSEAWLGPSFQMTSQINVVKPGGQAQNPHRDYHLGFQDDAVVSRFPLSVQVASQFLTLQGAVAHTDMSVASGPTLLLPFSQQYPLGYLAWRKPEFINFFQQKAVQFPLNKGDAVFFSPALFHAAGTNTESADRVANLLQVSSAFGKAMETVNRLKMTKLVYPVLLAKKQNGRLRFDEPRTVGASVTDGYSFPTNLDSDPPIEGSAPETVQTLLERALSEEWPVERFHQHLNEAAERRLA